VSIQAVIVEDDDFTRLMIARSLTSEGVQVLAECSNAADALEQAKLLKPNLLLVDLHLGIGPSGIDVARELRLSAPKLGVVFLTSFEDPRALNPNLPELPYGSIYLNKKNVKDIKILMAAIAEAVDFKAWRAKTTTDSSSSASLARLSNAQLETLRLMAQGLSNAEIAKRRFVTEKSVETSISRLAKALGLKSDPSINQRVHLAKVFFRSIGADPGGEN
jgi:DNA-binding NarL/FixJ family response regulator